MDSSFSLLLFLTIISSSFCLPRIQKRDAKDDAYWNDAVGDIVRDLAAEFLEEKGHFIEIDDFSDVVGPKWLNGMVKATGGSIGNFSTLRFVNISVSTTENSVTVFLQVKLDNLRISFSHFEAEVRILSVDGSINATVGNNLLTAQVTLKLDDDDTCKATLELLELTEFGDIDLFISTDFVNDKFVSKLANMVVNKFTPELKPIAEQKMRELAAPYIGLACDFWL